MHSRSFVAAGTLHPLSQIGLDMQFSKSDSPSTGRVIQNVLFFQMSLSSQIGTRSDFATIIPQIWCSDASADGARLYWRASWHPFLRKNVILKKSTFSSHFCSNSFAHPRARFRPHPWKMNTFPPFALPSMRPHWWEMHANPPFAFPSMRPH